MPTYTDVLVLVISSFSNYVPFIVAGVVVGLLAYGLRTLLRVGRHSDARYSYNTREEAYAEAEQYGISHEEVDANFMDAYRNA